MSHENSPNYGIPFKTANEVRSLFIDFFKKKAHTFVPSSSIAPSDDPSIFFTNSGMNQFKSIFLGGETELKRAVNSQKCLRVSGKHNDLEEVGLDGTHHTFFEMLGNWSFGDFYKKEIIKWSWEFLTEVCQIPKNRLFVTVYKDDDEAEELWKSETDIEPEKILRFDKDNFWEMGAVGPCGPCSEIHFDKGDLSTQKDFYKDPKEGVNGENERFVEIWNLVFMQNERLQDGSLRDLKAKHVDTGAGFERLCSLVQNKLSNYDTDVFSPIIEKISSLTAVPYDEGEKGVPHRVIADHIRALVFSICDGITPGNEGRGYVIRRILRRASRFAYGLGQEEAFLFKLVDTVVDLMKEAFPDLEKRRAYIKEVIKSDEARFLRTLGQGLSRFEKLSESLTSKSKKVVSGEDAFLFHDTYGFPFDLTRQISKERGFEVDEASYKKCMEEQKERARKASKFSGDLLSDDAWTILDSGRDSEFLGYETLSSHSKALRYCELEDEIYVVLDKTPFYAESGGQVGDQGVLSNKEVSLKVMDTIKVLDLHVHKCHLISGLVNEKTLSSLDAKVDEKARYDTIRNHSATHLLHAALKEILGEHVEQQGSYVAPDRLRLDFTHHQGLTESEIGEIEDRVNGKIRENLAVTTDIMGVEEAKASGATALFGEKYGKKVRVLTMGAFSKELCGGTHVERTGDIGGFAIVTETSIASSVRRIEALTGRAFSHYVSSQRKKLSDLSSALRVQPSQAIEKAKEMVSELKTQAKLLESFKKDRLVSYVSSLLGKEVFSVKDKPVYLAEIDSKMIEKKDLQGLLEKVQEKLSSGLCVMRFKDAASANLLVCVAGSNLKEFHAGKVVKELALAFEGRGGGRPDKAQAGIKKYPSEAELLKKLKETLS